MPTVEITSRSGRKAVVEFDQDPTEADIDEVAATLEPEDNGIGVVRSMVGSAVQGLAGNASGLLKSIGENAALLNRRVDLGGGNTPEETPTYRLGSAIESGVNKLFPTNPKYAEGFWTGGVPQGLGQVGGMVVGGGMVSGGVRALAKNAGIEGAQQLGAKAGLRTALTLGFGSGADDAYGMAKQRGDSDDLAGVKGLAYGVVATAIEGKLGVGRLLKRFGIGAETTEEALEKAAKGNLAKTGLKEAFAGATEEALQAASEGFIVNGEADLNQMAKEGGVGGVVQGLLGIAGHAKYRPQARRTLEWIGEKQKAGISRAEQRETGLTDETLTSMGIPIQDENANREGVPQTIPIPPKSEEQPAPSAPLLGEDGKPLQVERVREGGIPVAPVPGIEPGISSPVPAEPEPEVKPPAALPTPTTPVAPVDLSDLERTIRERQITGNLPVAPVPRIETLPDAPERGKFRVGNNPTLFTLLKRLPQSKVEREAGEQPVQVRNDKTGEVSVVLETDLLPVKERTAEQKAPAGPSLDDQLRAAKLDPSVFPDARSKQAALKRQKAVAPAQTPEAADAKPAITPQSNPKEFNRGYIHINLRGGEIDPAKPLTGWVLPAELGDHPNAMSTKYGAAGKTAVFVPKEWVTESKTRPAKIKDGYVPKPEHIAVIPNEAMRPSGTVDWTKVFTEKKPAPAPEVAPKVEGLFENSPNQPFPELTQTEKAKQESQARRLVEERYRFASLEVLRQKLAEFDSKATAPPPANVGKAGAKVGDAATIMSVPSVLADTKTIGGVRWDIFNGAKMAEKRAAVRTIDVDSGEVLGLKQFPTYDAAEAYYRSETGKAEKLESPQPDSKGRTPERVASPAQEANQVAAEVKAVAKTEPAPLADADRREQSRAKPSKPSIGASAIRPHLRRKWGLTSESSVVIVDQPGADTDAEAVFQDGELRRIEINVANISSLEQLDETLEHELAHAASEGVDMDSLLDKLSAAERANIEATMDRLGYDGERTNERTARQLHELAKAWRGRSWFSKLAGEIMRLANRLGFRITRLSAESMAARQIAEALRSARQPVRERLLGLKGARAVVVDGREAVLVPPGQMARAQSIVAHHGTPHKVDKFTTAKIGTGEGAQVYGWGLYFAENSAVSGHYQRGLTEKEFIARVRKDFGGFSTPQEAADAIKAMPLNEGQRKLLVALEKEDWWGFDYPHQAVQAVIREPHNFSPLSPEVAEALKTFGNHYTVSLNVEPEDLLDWNKPLSEQSEKVKAAMAKAGINQQNGSGKAIYHRLVSEKQFSGKKKVTWVEIEDALGDNSNPVLEDFFGMQDEPMSPAKAMFEFSAKEQQEILSELRKFSPDIADRLTGLQERAASAKSASEYLASLGIKGIRYLDQWSRGIRSVTDAESHLERMRHYLTGLRKSGNESLIKQGEAQVAAAEFELEKAKAGGTYNYVVFNENDITITHENDEPVERREQSRVEGDISETDGEESGDKLKARQHAVKTLGKESVPDSVKDKMRNIMRRVLTNAEAQARADELFAEVDSDPDRALALSFTREMPGAVRIFLWGRIGDAMDAKITELEADKKTDEAEALAKKRAAFLDSVQAEAGTDLGQSLQAFHILTGKMPWRVYQELYKRMLKKYADKFAAEVSDILAPVIPILNQAGKGEKQQELAKFMRSLEPAKRKRIKPDMISKLLKASELGALDDASIYELFAEKNKLPKESVSVMDDIKRRAEAVKKLPEGSVQRLKATADLLSFIRDQAPIPLGDLAWGVFYANILSGMTTQGVNALSTGTSGMGSAAAASHGNPVELVRIFTSIIGNIPKGLSEGWNILTSGFNPRAEFKWERPVSALERDLKGWQKMLVPLRYVSRAMQAADAAFYLPLREAKASSLARQSGIVLPESDFTAQLDREAAQMKELGIEPDRAWRQRREDQLMEEARPAEVVSGSQNFAANATFNRPVYGMMGLFASGINKATTELERHAAAHPEDAIAAHLVIALRRFVVPFTNIIANVVNESLNYTPLGAGRTAWAGYRMKRGADGVTLLAHPYTEDAAADLYSKSVMGTAFMAAILAAALKGLDDDDKVQLYGGGPVDPDKRKALRETGWVPYSIKIGKTYYPYQNWVIGPALAMMGQIADVARFDPKKFDSMDTWTRVAVAARAVPQVLTQMSFLDSMARLAGWVERPQTSKNAGTELASQLGRTASSFVPYGGANFFKQLDRWFDPTVYDAKGGVQAALTGAVPFVRANGKPVLNALGQPVENPLWNRFVSPERDSLMVELARRNALPGMPEQGTMTRDEYYKLVAARGAILNRLLTARRHAIANAKTDEAAQKIVEEASRLATTTAKRRLGLHRPENKR